MIERHLFHAWHQEAKKHIKSSSIRSVDFSKQTYLLHFQEEGGESFYPFLQVDELGEVKDCFCTCEEANPICIHLATSYFFISPPGRRTWSTRFYTSLIHELSRLYAAKYNYNEAKLEKSQQGQYDLWGIGDAELLFSLQSTDFEHEKLIQAWTSHRVGEYEHNSIKFSNLSEQDLEHWRQGRPSQSLRYELSFWSDLAKYIFFLEQSHENIELEFDYSSHGLPSSIYFQVATMKVYFTLDEELLVKIIPFLSYYKSPLKVYGTQEQSIEEISYDQKQRCLILSSPCESDLNPINSHGKLQPISLGNQWTFYPQDGFYPIAATEALGSRKKIREEDIASFLKENEGLCQRFLSNYSFSNARHELKYKLCFDSLWNLELRAFLFEEGDLEKKHSCLYSPWVFLEDQGFFFLENILFHELCFSIPKDAVSQFIHKYRFLFQEQEAYTLSMSHLEEPLNYHFSPQEGLRFFSGFSLKELENESIDFGDFYYLPGDGFYMKRLDRMLSFLHLRKQVPLHELSSFINMYKDDLHCIDHFFAAETFIREAFLVLELRDEKIFIYPEYQLKDSVDAQDFFVCEDIAYLPSHGFSFVSEVYLWPKEYRQELRIESYKAWQFFHEDFPLLEPFIKKIDPRLQEPHHSYYDLLHLEESQIEGEKQLKVQLQLHSHLGSVDLVDIWQAIREGKHFLFSSAGRLFLKDSRFDWIRHLDSRHLNLEASSVSMSLLEFMKLQAFETLEENFLRQGRESSQKIMHGLKNRFSFSKPDISLLKSDLRPYQEEGLSWLWFLYEHQLSGLLCDDMGLGKTHQAMALLSASMQLKTVEKKQKKYFLILCPTSVLYHWQEKLEKFLPTLKVRLFHGPKRSLEGFLNGCDILLSSYGVIRRQAEDLRLIHFDLMILDEVQLAKNANSKLHRALLSIPSSMRVGLTGTPVENNLKELKSLFDLVLPKYMPEEKEYKKKFIIPIEKEHSQKQLSQLQRFIAPFIMRRKKTDVLLQLPEKSEDILHCRLSEEQELAYNQLIRREKEGFLKDLEDERKNISYMHVFSLLMRLKQLCNHPAIIENDVKGYKHYSSGKWDLFIHLLRETLQSGQKLVVFSQYMLMLDIIEEYLQEQGIAFASLRGSTVNRGAQMKRFQEDSECRVFVASLFAAGLGIELTAASVVIHYDRWWNAARENQATDRVHRLGQSRGVQVFKLVTLGTLEERIDAMITHKGKLMENVFKMEEKNVLKYFSRGEIISLLREVHGEDQSS